MPRGGRRQGKPGATYGNRTDLNAQKVVRFPSEQYGRQAAQVRAQQAMQAAGPPASRGIQFDNQQVSTAGVSRAAEQSRVPGQPPQTPPIEPGGLPDLFAPTTRPDEPVTAGMPFGPGPGPMVMPTADDAAMDRLRMLARATGSPSLLRLIEAAED